MRIEVLDMSRWVFYWNKPSRPALQGSEESEKSEDTSKQKERKGKFIGSGTLPISQVSSSTKNVWVDLSTGGGRVNIDVQFNLFVDPRIA